MNYFPIPGVVCACICDEYFLIAAMEARPRVQFVRGINETGAFFWDLLAQRLDRAEIIRRTVDCYAVSTEDAGAAFDGFVTALCEAGYLTQEDSL